VVIVIVTEISSRLNSTFDAARLEALCECQFKKSRKESYCQQTRESEADDNPFNVSLHQVIQEKMVFLFHIKVNPRRRSIIQL
jgi:hypothetical protein